MFDYFHVKNAKFSCKARKKKGKDISNDPWKPRIGKAHLNYL